MISAQAAMKDLVSPGDFSFDNCGEVIIRKQSGWDGQPASFNALKPFATDPASGNTISLSDDGVQSYNNVLIGSNLVVSEDLGTPPAGYSPVDIDCSASSGVSPLTNVGAGMRGWANPL